MRSLTRKAIETTRSKLEVAVIANLVLRQGPLCTPKEIIKVFVF